MPIRAYAKLYHFAIVPAGWGDITDQHGNIATGLAQESPGIFTARLDLDKTYFHVNFNSFDKILADHNGDIVKETVPGFCSTPGNCSGTADLLGESGFVVLQRTDAGYDKGVSVRSIMDQYNLTRLSTYQHQARRALNMQRMTAAPNVLAWKYNTNGYPDVSQLHGQATDAIVSKQAANSHDMRRAHVPAPVGGWPVAAEPTVMVSSTEFVRAFSSHSGR